MAHTRVQSPEMHRKDGCDVANTRPWRGENGALGMFKDPKRVLDNDHQQGLEAVSLSQVSLLHGRWLARLRNCHLRHSGAASALITDWVILQSDADEDLAAADHRTFMHCAHRLLSNKASPASQASSKAEKTKEEDFNRAFFANGLTGRMVVD